MDSFPPDEDPDPHQKKNPHQASITQSSSSGNASNGSPSTIRGHPRLASGGSLAGRLNSVNNSPLPSPCIYESDSDDDFQLSPALMNSPLMLGSPLREAMMRRGHRPPAHDDFDETSRHELEGDASPDIGLWTPKHLRDLPKPVVTPEKKLVKKLASGGSLTGRMKALKLTQSPIVSPGTSPASRFFGFSRSGQIDSCPSSPTSPTVRFSKREPLNLPETIAAFREPRRRNHLSLSLGSQLDVTQPEPKLSGICNGKGKGKEKHVRFSDPLFQGIPYIREHRAVRNAIALPFTKEQHEAFLLENPAEKRDSESLNPGEEVSLETGVIAGTNINESRAREKSPEEPSLAAIQNEVLEMKKKFDLRREQQLIQEGRRFKAYQNGERALKEHRGIFYRGPLMDKNAYHMRRQRTINGSSLLREEMHPGLSAIDERFSLLQLPQGQMELDTASTQRLHDWDPAGFFPAASTIAVARPVSPTPGSRSLSPGYNEATVNPALAERIRRLPLKGRVLRKGEQPSEAMDDLPDDDFSRYEPFSGNDPGGGDATIR